VGSVIRNMGRSYVEGFIVVVANTGRPRVREAGSLLRHRRQVTYV
jgi:hypothetical protein